MPQTRANHRPQRRGAQELKRWLNVVGETGHEGGKDIARERKRRTANKADAAPGSSKVSPLAEDTRLHVGLSFRLVVYHMGHLGDADRRNTQSSGAFPRASHATAVPMTACPAQRAVCSAARRSSLLPLLGDRSCGGWEILAAKMRRWRTPSAGEALKANMAGAPPARRVVPSPGSWKKRKFFSDMVADDYWAENRR